MGPRAILLIILGCVYGILAAFVSPWTLLNVTVIAAICLIGFGLGAASVLCSGKNFFPKNNDTKTVTNKLMTRMMVCI